MAVMRDETQNERESEGQQISPQARRIARLLLLGIGLLVGLGLCEVSLRAWTSLSPNGEDMFPDPLAILIEPYGELGYKQRPGAVFEYPITGKHATANAAGYRGPLVSVQKPAGVVRIVLLGGSATHGWGVSDDETIDSYMRSMLKSSHPNQTFEVVNLAFDAHDSWQMYERLRSDALPMDPDVVIMNAGVNDVRNGRYPNLQDRDPRTMIWEGALHDLREGARRGHVPLWLRVKHHVYLARVPAFLRSLQSDPGEHVQSDSGPYSDGLDYFERNVKRVTDASLDIGAAVLLSTPPSSLESNFAPTDTSPRDYWITNATTTQEYRDSLAARMHQVQEEYAAEGQPVFYLGVEVPGGEFLDDAHLTADGNRLLAAAFVDQVSTILDDSAGR
jgi:lysophospholipase L1-like esterase